MATKLFSELGLSPALLAAVDTLGFKRTTPVQAATIPLFLGNKDVCVEACTGSGKTLAYAIPLVERLLRSESVDFLARPNMIGAVVVAPTRELARQIYRVIRSLTGEAPPKAASSKGEDDASKGKKQKGKKGKKGADNDDDDDDDETAAAAAGGASTPHLRTLLFVGGDDVLADLSRLSRGGCNIMVGTPGRLLDIVTRLATGTVALASTSAGAGGDASSSSSSAAAEAAPTPATSILTVKALEVLILDEADTLLDLGFEREVGELLSRLPKQRRTGLFSATQTREVKALARAGLRNPAVISVQVQMQQQQQQAPAAPTAGGEKGKAAPAAGKGKAEAKKAEDGSDDSNDDDDEDDEEAAAADSAVLPPPSSTAQAVPTGLSNYYWTVASPAHKLEALFAFLRFLSATNQKAIVFVLTCAAVDFLGAVLNDDGVRKAAGLPLLAASSTAFPIVPLHGQMAAKKRTSNYNSFLHSSGKVGGCLICTDVAARGIDIPDCPWILQYDPPKDPAFYIHRVGRTARAGKRGNALLLLLEKEASGYLALLAAKRVPIAERAAIPGVPAKCGGTLAFSEEASNILSSYKLPKKLQIGEDAAAGAGSSKKDSSGKEKEEEDSTAKAEAETAALLALPRAYVDVPCKDEAGTLSTKQVGFPNSPSFMRLPSVRALLTASVRDREVLEKGTRAFVSYLRGYGEHTLKYVFRLGNLDCGALAATFGCLRLPKVEELRAYTSAIAYPGLPGVDTGCIAYKDAKREEQRQKRLVENGETEAARIAARDARRAKAIEEAKEAKKAMRRKAAAAADGEGGDGAEEGEGDGDKVDEDGKRRRSGPKKKRQHSSYAKQLGEEWDVLAAEERLEKRLKAGKITKQEYKRELAKLNRDLGIDEEDGALLYSAAIEESKGALDARDKKLAEAQAFAAAKNKRQLEEEKLRLARERKEREEEELLEAALAANRKARAAMPADDDDEEEEDEEEEAVSSDEDEEEGSEDEGEEASDDEDDDEEDGPAPKRSRLADSDDDSDDDDDDEESEDDRPPKGANSSRHQQGKASKPHSNGRAGGRGGGRGGRGGSGHAGKRR